ncbi:unnamed protein product, partial [Allacma fusca]
NLPKKLPVIQSQPTKRIYRTNY